MWAAYKYGIVLQFKNDIKFVKHLKQEHRKYFQLIKFD